MAEAENGPSGHRLHAQHLGTRLPPESLELAAYGGLQDSAPRAGLLSLHARVEGVGPDAWDDPSLAQVWGPRGAVYLVPADAVAAFTIGRGDAPRPRAVIRWDTRTTTVLEVGLPEVSPDVARLDLARRFVAWFGDGMRPRFARWSGLDDAAAADVLARVEPAEVGAGPIEGVRFLPPFDPYLYGRTPPAGSDTFFSGVVLVDGRIVGVFARRQHHVRVRTRSRALDRIEAEALTLPLGRPLRFEVVD